MGIDKRETILSRLHEVTLPGIVGLAADPDLGTPAVYRNRGQIEGLPYPFVVLLDGDEEYDPVTGVPSSVVPLTAQVMRMTPQIWLFPQPRDTLANTTVQEAAAPIGPEMSLWRNRVYDVIRDDATLEALCSPGGRIRLESVRTDMQTGGQMLGQLLFTFSFRYTLRPSDI